MSSYDIIVIGAGPGGATLAALCAKAGKRVLLAEKNDRAGGKALTMHRAGLGYEMWPVIGIPAGPSRYEELLAAIGGSGEVPISLPPEAELGQGGIVYHTPEGDWRRMSASATDPGALDGLQATFGITAAELEPLMTMGAEVLGMSDEDLDALQETPILDWLGSYNLPAGVMAYIGVLLNMFFLVGLDRLPASEGIRICLRGFVLAGAPTVYYRGGMGKVMEVASRYVESQGGTFLTHAQVQAIAVDNGRVTGIDTEYGRFEAPVVVSNAGIQPTVLNLAGAENFPAEYVDYVRALEPSWGIAGLRYFLDAPVFPPAGLAFGDWGWWDTKRYEQALAGDWPDVPQLYWSTPALWDHGLAPGDGSQVVLIGTLASPDPESSMSEDSIARVHETCLDAWPGMEGHIVRQEPYTTRNVSDLTRASAVPGAGGECIGIAQVIEQEGRRKPDARTPLDGLYIVGCDAGGKGVATHQAVDSGFRVAEMVLADMGK